MQRTLTTPCDMVTARPVTIYFVRHGRTDWNAEWRLQGQTDIPLNDEGRAQARRNGAMLAELLPDPAAIDHVASPLVRARETMEIIREALGLPRAGYRTDERLKEIHFGAWQGHSWDELRAARPEEVEARFRDPWNTRAPGCGGESYRDLSTRALAWLAEVERDTLVVSHGGINRCLRGHFEGMATGDIPHLKVPQDRIMVLETGTGRITWR